MATARCLAFISKVLGDSKSSHREEALETANMVRERIVRLYTRNDGLGGFYPPEVNILSPGPEMSLFSRIVEGDKRCLILRNYFKREGHTWPGSDENRFLSQTSESVINGKHDQVWRSYETRIHVVNGLEPVARVQRRDFRHPGKCLQLCVCASSSALTRIIENMKYALKTLSD
ncbi:hypothetical protein THAOC_30717, partial [Thalassiosira oceanica]